MATTVPGPPPAHLDDESAVHFYAREGTTFMRWAVRGLLVVTVITMFTFWFWAIIPATLLVAAYLVFLLTRTVEQRSDHHEAAAPATATAAATPAAAEPTRRYDADVARPFGDRVDMRLLKHETRIVVVGIAAVIGLAAFVAALFFAGPLFLLSIPFLGAYMILIGGPVWLAAMEDEIEEDGKRHPEPPAGPKA